MSAIKQTKCDFCEKRHDPKKKQSDILDLMFDDAGLISISLPFPNLEGEGLKRQHFDLCDQKCLEGFLWKLYGTTVKVPPPTQ